MSLIDDMKCDGCGSDLRGEEIPSEDLHFYNSGPAGEPLYSIEDYIAVFDQLENPTTHYSRVIGVEYGYDSPERYDGVSEWRCPDCGRREGRWSGKVLQDDELEPRFGGRP